MYKVGDMVRCTWAGTSGLLKHNVIYKVIKVDSNADRVFVEGIDSKVGFFKDRFEKYAPEEYLVNEAEEL